MSDLFGDVGRKRREHPQHRTVDNTQGRQRRQAPFRQFLVVCPWLGQFQKIVAEGTPEEVLDQGEGLGVVKGLEGFGSPF